MGLIERSAISIYGGVRHLTEIDAGSFAGERNREGRPT